MKYTVFGSQGFIGSHVASEAVRLGHRVECPGRQDRPTDVLGHVVYCIGMTADFRRFPHQTVDAHVTRLQQILQDGRFESFTYLSSTRVYQHVTADLATEEMPVPVNSNAAGDLYNLSKLLGESLVLQHSDTAKVVRLSNVIGNDVTSANFLFSVMRDCVMNGKVTLQQALDSAKDYVTIDDVVDVLLKTGPRGTQQLYNVASGNNLTHRELLDEIVRHTDAQIELASDAVPYTFPRISIDRIQQEFQFQSSCVIERLPLLIDSMRKHFRTAA